MGKKGIDPGWQRLGAPCGAQEASSEASMPVCRIVREGLCLRPQSVPQSREVPGPRNTHGSQQHREQNH